MRRLADIDSALGESVAKDSEVKLGDSARGFRGVISGLAAQEGGGVSASELERRLLEMGFVEGANVEILHEGLIGHDPIAVRLDDTRVALRRRHARSVLVRPHVP